MAAAMARCSSMGTVGYSSCMKQFPWVATLEHRRGTAYPRSRFAAILEYARPRGKRAWRAVRAMSAFTIYHNPKCTKSRATLALLQDRGVEPTVIEYLKTPPTAAELKAIVA